MAVNFLRDFSMKHKYQALFSSDLGQEVLEHICKEGYITRPTFVPGDPQQSTLNEGSRRLALSILRAVKKTENEIQETIERTIG